MKDLFIYLSLISDGWKMSHLHIWGAQTVPGIPRGTLKAEIKEKLLRWMDPPLLLSYKGVGAEDNHHHRCLRGLQQQLSSPPQVGEGKVDPHDGGCSVQCPQQSVWGCPGSPFIWEHNAHLHDWTWPSYSGPTRMTWLKEHYKKLLFSLSVSLR